MTPGGCRISLLFRGIDDDRHARERAKSVVPARVDASMYVRVMPPIGGTNALFVVPSALAVDRRRVRT
jgi:hypothetical protein